MDISPREAQYLSFIIRADLETLNNNDDSDPTGDAIERVLAQRLLTKLTQLKEPDRR